MKIGIIGAGKMGLGLGLRWAEAGHSVLFSYSQDLQRVQERLEGVRARAEVGTPAEAASFGDLVLLSVRWASLRDALEQAGSLAGRVLVSLVNPMNETYSDLLVGHATSAAETVASLAEGARVVEAFNGVFAETLYSDSVRIGGQVPTVFFCGDDASAKTLVAELIKSTGFDDVDAGDLKAARYIEPLGMLFTRLAYGLGMGPNIAPKLLRR
jgi:8-hydroxy-5-deazaflavin:NADPH oxidoreductase